MSLDQLDPLLSAPTKLAAMSMLANVREVEFALIRDHLDLSDSDLSKQICALATAKHVTVRKTRRGPTRKTWFAATELAMADTYVVERTTHIAAAVKSHEGHRIQRTLEGSSVTWQIGLGVGLRLARLW